MSKRVDELPPNFRHSLVSYFSCKIGKKLRDRQQPRSLIDQSAFVIDEHRLNYKFAGKGYKQIYLYLSTPLRMNLLNNSLDSFGSAVNQGHLYNNHLLTASRYGYNSLLNTAQ